MKKVAFINDTSSWYHWGCTGTCEAIKETISARGYEVVAVPIQSLYACQGAPQRIEDFDNPQFFNRFFRENLAVTAPILQSDMVVINGEGSLHGVSHIALVLLYLAYASKRICNKNVQIINHSCYPDDAGGANLSQTELIYRGVYRFLDFVAVREHYSQLALKEIGIDATLAFDCLPLYIRAHRRLAASERGRSLVVSGSVAWKSDGMAGLVAYMRSMAADGYAVSVLTGAKADPAQDDLVFLKALKQAAPEGWRHVVATSMDDWLSTIQSAALLVSGRFHYTIAACTLDTPCIVLDSNTPKNRAISEEAGLLEPLPCTLDNLEAALHERTRAAINAPAMSSVIRQEWFDRAERNFAGLPT